jgi:dolichol-phosphate mannosyltransferase
VREVPIVFRERRAGDSKMSARIALEAVWKVPALKMRLP